MNMGDQESSFIAVYDAHADALFRFALFSVSDRELAKDLVAETFTKVWSYLAEGNIVDNLKAFCYRTLKNLIIDYWRKHGSISLDALTEAGFDPVGEDGRENVEHDEAYKAARDAIAVLPAAFREVIHLRYVEEYSPKGFGCVREFYSTRNRWNPQPA
jgi:RNA polymerase sigma-70 factor (ECF subfamily)